MSTREIHRATLNGDLNKVRVLIRRDRSRLDSQNNRGATPLMLASLYGYSGIVEFLIHRGASLTAKDADGNEALDYAKRGEFARNTFRFYRAQGFRCRVPSTNLISRRSLIAKILAEPSPVASIIRSRSHGAPYFFKGRGLTVLKAVAYAEYPVGAQKQTAAFIAEGASLKPTMCAVSGWTPLEKPVPGLIDSGEYTSLVQEACRLLDFHLPHSRDDNILSIQQGGRWFACHSEKKLAVYWVREQLRHAFGSADLARLRDLRTADLPLEKRHATIYLDHVACLNCISFAQELRKATGIEFLYVACHFVQRGERKNVDPAFGTGSYCPNCYCKGCTRVEREKEKAQQRDDGNVKPPGGEDLIDGDEALEEALVGADGDADYFDGVDAPLPLIIEEDEDEEATGAPPVLPDPISILQGRSGYFASTDSSRSSSILTRPSPSKVRRSSAPSPSDDNASNYSSKPKRVRRRRTLQDSMSSLNLANKFSYRGGPRSQSEQQQQEAIEDSPLDEDEATEGQPAQLQFRPRRRERARAASRKREAMLTSRSTLRRNAEYRLQRSIEP